jgi:hypothetical protein
LKKSTPSAFGRGEKTVMDEGYHSGREIHAADIQMAPGEKWVPGPGQFLRSIETNVSTTMFAGRKAVPKLYKLAIYKEGGHFDWHMDSTHSDQHHATVLVALNTSWTGGDLLLRHNGVETRVDMKPKAAEKGSKTELQAVAFYTDRSRSSLGAYESSFSMMSKLRAGMKMTQSEKGKMRKKMRAAMKKRTKRRRTKMMVCMTARVGWNVYSPSSMNASISQTLPPLAEIPRILWL